jgi:anti-sigma factor RsiW
MNECRRIQDGLAALSDNELDTSTRVELERHLAQCAPCRRAAADESGGRAVLRASAPRLKDVTLPPGLRSRCERIARSAAAPAESPWLRLVPASLTGVLMLFTTVALFALATHRSNTLLAAQLTADHSKCFAMFAPAGGASADARGVEQMLADRHGWNVRVPPSSDEADVRLIGARRCLYADGRVPHVMYRVRGQDVSLYMLPGVTREPAEVATFGHRSRIWTGDGTTYVLVWPETAGDMSQAARYVMQEAH